MAERPVRFPALRALRHRDYRLYLGGQLVSLVGTWMQSVAQSWLVYRLTGSSVLLGLMGFAGQIPMLLLAPLGGSLADTRDRHRIVVVSQAVAMLLAFLLAGLTLSGHVRLWEVFTLAFLAGVVNAFDVPARQAFVVEMVGRDDLMNAIALNSSMVNGARVIGPALAGLLVAAVGEGWCFAINGLSFLAVLAGLLRMTRDLRPAARAREAGASALGHVAEGFAYVSRTPPVRSLLALLGLISLMGMPYSVLMPIYADRILHAGPRGLGLLMGASGLGALLGALRLAFRKDLRGLGRWVATATASFGVCLVAFAWSTSLWLSTLILVPAGFSVMVQMAASNTLIQSMVPDRLRGRVMAIYAMMFMGVTPFGALMAGLLATTLGAPGTVALGGVACLAGAAVFALNLPTFRLQARELVGQARTAAAPPPEVRAGGEAVASSG